MELYQPHLKPDKGQGKRHAGLLQWMRVNAISLLGYLASARFWFESLQNWQSEFLAIAAMVVLTIFLRQRGSP
jgi:hypothetical protein